MKKERKKWRKEERNEERKKWRKKERNEERKKEMKKERNEERKKWRKKERNEERKKEMKKERKKWRKKERNEEWKKERKKWRKKDFAQRPVISCVTASCQSMLPNRRQFHLQASNFFLKHSSVAGYNMLSRNVGDLAPSDKAPYCRRTETWSAPLREFKNSQNLGLFKNKTITSNQEWNVFRTGVTCDNRRAVD
jgi:hypothetical protein